MVKRLSSQFDGGNGVREQEGSRVALASPRTQEARLVRVRFRKEIANRFVEYAAILTAISKDSWHSSKSNTLFFILLSVVHIASLSLSAYFLFYLMREIPALHEIEAA